MNPYDIAPILKRIVHMTNRASDIVFSPGNLPKVIADGQLAEVPIKELRLLTPYQTEMLALNLLRDRPRALERFVQTGSTDVSYTIEGTGRFRINIFRQRNSVATIMRVIPTVIPSFESLGLPPVLRKVTDYRNGIVLITGPTGCGKSSTLAAIISLMSKKYAYHIVTIEDPIEFLHPRGKSIIHQREMGVDTDSFADSLRAALRQAPQVIMVGEMRDRESVEIALEAAETGHLILSTLHTIDAVKSIERIIGAFPKDQENFIRGRFSQTFKLIASQRLIPRSDGKGRVLSAEVLVSTERTRSYVVKGSDSGGTLTEAMQDGSVDGMQTFDMDLMDLVDRRLITRETAIQYATNPNNLALKLGLLKEDRSAKKTPKSSSSARDIDTPSDLDDIPIIGLDQ